MPPHNNYPRQDMTATEDFQRAVDAAVAQKVEALLPDLLAKLAAANAKPQEGDRDFVGSLALQLAELTGQGQGRVYVAPEVLEKRRKAQERMVDIILELRAQKQIPAYRLTNKVFLKMGPGIGEMVIDPFYRDNNKILRSQEIDWPGVPNLAMEPINDAALRVFEAFAESVGHTGGAQPADRLFAVSEEGVVLRGNMAEILINDAPPFVSMPDSGEPVAGLRRKDTPPSQKVRILGSLQPPVEVS